MTSVTMTDQAQPVVTLARAPFGIGADVLSARVGDTIASTMPTTKGLLICRLNGGPEFVSRQHWDQRLSAGDILEWMSFPGGDNEDVGFLQTAILVVIGAASSNYYLIALAFAQAAVNLVFSPRQNTADELKQASPTYATGVSGNQARLYQVVPKICGRHQSFPPFAAQPYNEYSEDGEQYLYVLMALGIGNHEIERVMIDDTDINHFSDVLTVTYLPPGTLPTVVHANVINSPEVSGQDMLSGQYLGGYTACAPRDLTADIALDIVGPRGIGIQDDDGNLGSLEVKWRVEIRSLNEFGTPLTPWATLASETRTAANREPQRWTTRYTLPAAIRPEIRVVRTDVKSPNLRALNDLVWVAMRAYLSNEATLNSAVAHFEVVMRSSKQLNGISQNRISVIATGMCRELLSDLTFGDEIATRNAGHWLADLWTSTTWGEGLDASEVDLQTIYDLSVLWGHRQDRFDYIFDTSLDADTAAQIIAGSGRARAFRRGGVRTVTRDQLVTMPRTAFTTRNTLPGSMVFNEELPQDRPDGVIVEYFDNRSWNYGQPIECPCPGVETMQRPLRVRLEGVTGRTHATREGLYHAAKITWRTQTVQCETEMQGALPAFGSAVRWQSELTRWQSGDVVDWDADTLTMTLTEPPTWSATAARYIVLIRDDGSPTDPIEVSPGATTTKVVLASAPDFAPSFDAGDRDRTQYLLGGLNDDEMLVKIASIADGGQQDGAQLYKISAFVDDARIHAVDNYLLPSPGEIQDPIDTSEGDPGGGTTPIVNITDHDFEQSSSSTPNQTGFAFNADGTLAQFYTGGSGYSTIPDEWLFESPREITDAEQFEVMFTLTAGVLAVGGDLLDAWLPCGVTYTFRVDNPGGTTGYAVVFVQIRAVSDLIIQDSASITIAAFESETGGE